MEKSTKALEHNRNRDERLKATDISKNTTTNPKLDQDDMNNTHHHRVRRKSAQKAYANIMRCVEIWNCESISSWIRKSAGDSDAAFIQDCLDSKLDATVMNKVLRQLTR